MSDRLSPETLPDLPAGIARPGYDRDAQQVGIVHFGIGAFHRAHQAWYTDRAMDADAKGWAIAGVSLRSAGVAHQLNPQGGLYTLTERSGDEGSRKVIGAVREVLVGGADDAAIVARIASPDCRIVSFTVTEKGYARAADGGLDIEKAEASFYPLLAEGLERRRAGGLPGLTLLCCDNLAHNGRVLERLMGEWIAARAPGLAEWFAAECTCPATMVDRIVPASTDDDLRRLGERLGVVDEGAVFTERFSQWVIEDRFAAGQPGWENHGAELVADVAPYETAKLRMLNGAHSALAYMGLERGHAFVHEAVADPVLRPLVDRLMRGEAAPTIDAAPGQDLDAYADALLARFDDPALNHRLVQIAMDGSQKVPQRWLATMAARQNDGASVDSLLEALGAWMRHLRRGGDEVNDPMGGELQAILTDAEPSAAMERIFGPGGLVPSDWTPDVPALIAAYEA